MEKINLDICKKCMSNPQISINDIALFIGEDGFTITAYSNSSVLIRGQNSCEVECEYKFEHFITGKKLDKYDG